MFSSRCVINRLPSLAFCSQQRAFNVSSSLCSPRHKLPKSLQNFLPWKQIDFDAVKHRAALGLRELWADTKMYARAEKKLLTGTPVASLSRMELEQMVLLPPELLKLFLISAAVYVKPLLILVLVPASFFLPRYVLTRHFWTPWERAQYQSETLLSKATLRNRLWLQLANSRVQGDDFSKAPPIRCPETSALFSRENRFHIDSLQTALWPLFSRPELALDALQLTNQLSLASLHGTFPFFIARNLRRRALVLAAHDQWLRKNGIYGLSRSELETAFFIRRLNFIQLNDEQLRRQLIGWTKLSSNLIGSSNSKGENEAPASRPVLAMLLYASVFDEFMNIERKSSI